MVARTTFVLALLAACVGGALAARLTLETLYAPLGHFAPLPGSLSTPPAYVDVTGTVTSIDLSGGLLIADIEGPYASGTSARIAAPLSAQSPNLGIKDIHQGDKILFKLSRTPGPLTAVRMSQAL